MCSGSSVLPSASNTWTALPIYASAPYVVGPFKALPHSVIRSKPTQHPGDTLIISYTGGPGGAPGDFSFGAFWCGLVKNSVIS